ncbi:MAG: hypothetical protein BWY11_02088 [Firmicutes bacterium ADurb.Bin182]|nr:MAG: hypothetical protein BWY11_02088 [Firmicutes bacterium ADurb.Bin182]
MAKQKANSSISERYNLRAFACAAFLLCAVFLFSCTPVPPEPVPPVTVTEGQATLSSTPNVAPTPTPTPYTIIDPEGDTIETRFRPPEGYERKPADGYGEFLRSQKLLPDGSPILLYNGEEAAIQAWHAAVLTLDVGDRDLQQCADAALRLRCEYLYSIGEYDKINYHLTNGDEFPYSKWREGYRLKVDGNTTSMVKTAEPDYSYEAFYDYLQVLFNYASTRSLYPESTVVAREDIQIGDIFIFSGSPGHCVIVMDVCENERGKKAILVGQSNMPAQQVHIVCEPGTDQPWLFLDEITNYIQIMSWSFTSDNIRRMP